MQKYPSSKAQGTSQKSACFFPIIFYFLLLNVFFFFFFSTQPSRQRKYIGANLTDQLQEEGAGSWE